jgi:hypothetical protein
MTIVNVGVTRAQMTGAGRGGDALGRGHADKLLHGGGAAMRSVRSRS